MMFVVLARPCGSILMRLTPNSFCTRLLTVAFNAADVRSLIVIVRVMVRETGFGPTAVIVADDTMYGMMRMLETLLEGVCDVRPFRDAERNAAEQWLRTMPIRPRIES